MARLTLALLGGLQASLDGQSIATFEYNKVKALLVYVAVEAHQPHARDSLAGLLWPDLPNPVARKNLSQALSNLRQSLGDRAADQPFLLSTHGAIAFNPDSDHELDLTTFNVLLAACDGHVHRHIESCSACAERLGQAVALYRDDFLAHFFLDGSEPFEEWAALMRESLRRRALRALTQLTAYYERQGQYEQAAHCVQRRVALDPWREAAHQDLMRILALTGRRNAALAHYQRFHQALAAELEVSPEPETIRLFEGLRASATSAAALPGPPARTHNFPARPDPFIGRQHELLQIAGLLEQPACRLLTLVGPGGVGKTRLAMVAAQQLATLFDDGVFFVPLAPLGSAEFVVSALAGALRFNFLRHKDPVDQLITFVRDKEMLLVLDNAEHLLGHPASAQAVTSLFSRLLDQAPRLTLLVTSRERLRLTGEWIYRVAGLEVPPNTVVGAENYDAVQLFVQCARRSDYTFTPAPGHIVQVVRICRLLAGLPLAIEMAASWAATIPADEIANQVEKDLDFLQAPARDVPERHGSIKAVFDHSWRLLTTDEQRVFAKLSVFRGGFGPEAAHQVAGASGAVLTALVDKSLLREEGLGRYDLHELLRQYAVDRLLAAGEAAAAQQDHAVYYLAMAESNSDASGWLEGMEVELANLRATLAWAQLAPIGAELGLRLAVGLTKFCYYHGYWNEARAWLEGALAHPGALLGTRARADALHALGHLLVLQSRYAAGNEQLTHSLELAESLQDLPLAARVRFELGLLARETGDASRARLWLEACIQQYERLNDPVGVCWGLVTLGEVAVMQGDAVRATAVIEQALVVFRERGDRFGIGWSLNHLGHAAQLQNDYQRAARLHAESLELFSAIGENLGTAWAGQSLGETALARNRPAEAATHFGQALQVFRDLGDHAGMAWCLTGLAAAAASDQPNHAAWLWGVAEALRQAIGAREAPAASATHQRLITQLRRQLGAEIFAAQWAAGQSTLAEDVIIQILRSQPRAVLD